MKRIISFIISILILAVLGTAGVLLVIEAHQRFDSIWLDLFLALFIIAPVLYSFTNLRAGIQESKNVARVTGTALVNLAVSYAFYEWKGNLANACLVGSLAALVMSYLWILRSYPARMAFGQAVQMTNQNNLEQAEALALRAQSGFLKARDRANLASAEAQLGVIRERQNNLPQAAVHFSRALTLYQAEGNLKQVTRLTATLENYRRSGVKMPAIPAAHNILPARADFGLAISLALCLGLWVWLIIQLDVKPLQASLEIMIAQAALLWLFLSGSAGLLSPARRRGWFSWVLFFIAWLALTAGAVELAMGQGWTRLSQFQTQIRPALTALRALPLESWVGWAATGGSLLIMGLLFLPMRGLGGRIGSLFASQPDLAEPGRQQKSQGERAVKAFNRLAEGEDSLAALALYEKHLAKTPALVPAATKATYHLLRWDLKHEKEDLDALNALGVANSSTSQVSQAAHQARQMQYQLSLAKAIQTHSFKELKSSEPSSDGKADHSYEHLGLAMVETLALGEKPTPAQATRTANTVRNLLEQARGAGEEPSQAWLLLAFWANSILEQYPKLIELSDQYGPPRQSSFSNAERLVQAALHHWGAGEVTGGNTQQALQVISHPRVTQSGPDNQARLGLDWGLRALEQGKPLAAVEWFSQYQENLPAGTSQHLRLLLDWGIAISALAAGQFATGRTALDRIVKEQPARAPQKDDLVASHNLISQAEYLKALSWLAETQSWPSRSPEAQADQEARVQNRSRWATLRETLLASVTAISKASAEDQAWRSHFIYGLLAYVDRNLTPSEEQIAQFTASLEHLAGTTGKDGASPRENIPPGLWKIQGELATRSQAALEAARLVKAKDAHSLKNLNEQALATLGDTIPACLRTAVYLTIWENDPAYDPLPDLRRIPVNEGNEALIGRSIAHVQAVQALQKLVQGCTNPKLSDEPLPSLTTLEDNPEAAGMGKLGAAVIQVRHANWEAAGHQLPTPDETLAAELAPARQFLEFYIAWKQQDVDTCQKVLQSGGSQNRYLNRYGDPTSAVRMLTLMNSLEPGHEEQSMLTVDEQFGQMLQPDSFSATILGLTIWMLEHSYASQAIEFIQLMRKKAATLEGFPPPEKESLEWLLQLLEGMACLQAGRYSACLEALEHFLDMPIPKHSLLRGKAAEGQLVEWARVLHIQVGLAMAAQISDHLDQRWPSVCRSLQQQADLIIQSPLGSTAQAQKAYANLFSGLASYMNINTLVDQAVIDQLVAARRDLNLKTSAAFIEQVTAKLILRKKVIEDFWANLSQGNFQESRMIYRNQLEPAFGEKMPHTIQLGMILADWDSATIPITELLKRLSILEYEAPELNPELVKKVKDYILDGDKLRHLTKLVLDKQFDEVTEFSRQTEWAGLEKGHMPVPVAIAQLYAYYRTENLDSAKNLGEGIRRQLTGWFKDYGLLIYGYSLYRQENYKQAGEIFEEIQTSTLLGHDVDMYWASSHFARGIQLLDVNNRKEAFDAFAHSLKKHKGEAGLVPLFFQFGFLNLEGRNGSRALQSFELSKKTLEGVPETPEVEITRLQADLGILLCKALMGQAGNVISGEEFTKLAERCQAVKNPPDGSSARRLEYSIRTSGISQALKMQVIDPKIKRKAEMVDFLRKQLDPLKKLADGKVNDPVISIVEALIELRLKPQINLEKALELLEDAARHGASSLRLNELLNGLLKTRQEALEKQKVFLSQFDLYLANGQVPINLRDQLVRSDALMEIYRSKRRYQPEEIIAPEVDSGVENLCQRLQHVLELARQENLMNAEEINRMQKSIEGDIKDLQQKEKNLCDIENKILAALAEHLRKQTI